jgi:hypothetical protein
MTASEQDNPGNRDLSSRLIGGIEPAMGDDAISASPALRAAFLAVGAGNLALWFASLIPPYQSWAIRTKTASLTSSYSTPR